MPHEVKMETQPPVPDVISYKGNKTNPWWWKYVSLFPLNDGQDLQYHEDLEYIDIEEALPKLIAEAERRERKKWLPKLHHLFANLPVTPMTYREMLKKIIDEII